MVYFISLWHALIVNFPTSTITYKSVAYQISDSVGPEKFRHSNPRLQQPTIFAGTILLWRA